MTVFDLVSSVYCSILSPSLIPTKEFSFERGCHRINDTLRLLFCWASFLLEIADSDYGPTAECEKEWELI